MGDFALALTDHGTMSGALHHIKACRDARVIPISGVEAYFRPDRSVRGKEYQHEHWHMVLWAKNLKGWHSLLRLTSEAYKENTEGGGFFQVPAMDWELMERYSEGIICSTACISGYLSEQILRGDSTGADKYLNRLKGIYGDDLWIEIQPHDFEDQRTANLEAVNLAQAHGLGFYTACDAHVPYKDWADTQQVVKLMNTKSSFKEQEKKKAAAEKSGDRDEGFAKLLPTAYLMDEQEIYDLYERAHPNLPEHIVEESIANTREIAKSITPFFLDKSDKMPRINKTDEESHRMIEKWCEEGFERIEAEGKTDEEMEVYRERYDYEIKVLEEKGVADYFCLIGDVVRWAKAQGIRVGVGRGSAAGCLVSYLIGITAIDPIPYKLLFERFLNPDRKGLPDIDLDFESARRDEVKDYVRMKFGADRVVEVIAHQTFAPKATILDVARVFDIPYAVTKKLNKTIDIRADDEETTLEELRTINEDLDTYALQYPEQWKHSLRLEGTIRNSSKHAAAVIITKGPAKEQIALERSKTGGAVTSWADRADFPAVSDHGFVKYDFLGVKGLDKQQVAVELIMKRHGLPVEEADPAYLEIRRDPYAVDENVLDIFRRGLTLGIWQFSSRGITDLVRSIKPDWLGDLSAANALYRPGPMGSGMTWEYAERKKMDPEDVPYFHDSVIGQLSATYGLMAYQENVMEICKALGNFTGGQADSMRKAMGKLYRLPGAQAQEYMEGFKATWDEGTEANGIDRLASQEIWNSILSFGGYGFNLSHSASYAVQAYEDAWLKCYYPAEYYLGLLTWPPSVTQKNSQTKSEFIRQLAREATVLGVELAGPDLNESDKFFTVVPEYHDDNEGDKIRYGLQSIKEVGDAASNMLIEKRPFGSYEEMMFRCEKAKVNKKVKDSLVKSGALDCFHMRDDFTGNEMIEGEEEVLGISLTMTPATKTHEKIIAENVFSIEELETMDDGEIVLVGGDVVKISPSEVKKGRDAGAKMAFVTVAFGANQWRVTFFPKAWKEFQELIESGVPVMVEGAKDTWQASISIKADAVLDIESWVEAVAQEEAEKEMAAA